jgi:hypothetical protein
MSIFSITWSSQLTGVAGLSTRPAAALADQPDGAVDVLARLRVEGDPRGTRLREVGHDAVHRLDHQVHVDRRGDAVLAQRLAHQRADGQVRHVVVVHDVEVDDVGTGREHRRHLLAETREIRGKYRGSDPGRLHDEAPGRVVQL